MDHIIYRDYIVNRRSFIYCSLAFEAPKSKKGHHYRRKKRETNELPPSSVLVPAVICHQRHHGAAPIQRRLHIKEITGQIQSASQGSARQDRFKTKDPHRHCLTSKNRRDKALSGRKMCKGKVHNTFFWFLYHCQATQI